MPKIAESLPKKYAIAVLRRFMRELVREQTLLNPFRFRQDHDAALYTFNDDTIDA